ncbi:MAG: 1-acyl-sn-glycerol-3-phosphate acyltransferase [Sorangiineae bacterium]|nr:1-acyl-sn-glycerol-3-phosphate acyltransferase [Polyangiaceae bacterium]MEB2323669.1 1-acyl-sn-glycerol-3-phosphate acyltransferase [Sorangiineae bacterium]
MLDLERLKRIELSPRPRGQILIANLGLVFDYRFPRKTEIVLEGKERLPKGGAFLAMNHTDRYNYWPLQYGMYREGLAFTATWVKGKYYENRFLGRFMDSTNNIPTPSRGYVITTEFRKFAGRPPNDDEYRVLRDLIDGKRAPGEPLPDDASDAVRGFLGGEPGAFLERFDALFSEMLREVIELNRRAIEELHLSVLVFPQGTRSKRLSRGHTGLAQMAQYLGAPIIPIGCNGSDRLYPGNSPFSKGGRVVYRVGEPLAVDGPELAPYRVPRDVLPLTDEASAKYGRSYQAITDIVMDRINALLDPEYQYAASGEPDGERGVARFV